MDSDSPPAPDPFKRDPGPNRTGRETSGLSRVGRDASGPNPLGPSELSERDAPRRKAKTVPPPPPGSAARKALEDKILELREVYDALDDSDSGDGGSNGGAPSEEDSEEDEEDFGSDDYRPTAPARSSALAAPAPPRLPSAAPGRSPPLAPAGQGGRSPTSQVPLAGKPRARHDGGDPLDLGAIPESEKTKENRGAVGMKHGRSGPNAGSLTTNSASGTIGGDTPPPIFDRAAIAAGQRGALASERVHGRPAGAATGSLPVRGTPSPLSDQLPMSPASPAAPEPSWPDPASRVSAALAALEPPEPSRSSQAPRSTAAPAAEPSRPVARPAGAPASQPPGSTAPAAKPPAASTLPIDKRPLPSAPPLAPEPSWPTPIDRRPLPSAPPPAAEPSWPTPTPRPAATPNAPTNANQRPPGGSPSSPPGADPRPSTALAAAPSAALAAAPASPPSADRRPPAPAAVEPPRKPPASPPRTAPPVAALAVEDDRDEASDHDVDQDLDQDLDQHLDQHLDDAADDAIAALDSSEPRFTVPLGEFDHGQPIGQPTGQAMGQPTGQTAIEQDKLRAAHSQATVVRDAASALLGIPAPAPAPPPPPPPPTDELRGDPTFNDTGAGSAERGDPTVGDDRGDATVASVPPPAATGRATSGTLRSSAALPRKRGVAGDIRYIATVVFGVRRANRELAALDAKQATRQQSRRHHLVTLGRTAVALPEWRFPAGRGAGAEHAALGPARDQLAKIEDERSQHAGQVVAADAELARVRRDREAAAKQHAADLAELTAELAALAKKLEPLEREAVGIRKRAADLHDALRRVDAKIAATEANKGGKLDPAEIAAELATLKADRKAIQSDEPVIAGELDALNPRIAAIEAARAEAHARRTELERAEQDDQRRAEDLLAAIGAKRKVVDRAAGDAETMRDKILFQLGERLYVDRPDDLAGQLAPIDEIDVELGIADRRVMELREITSSVDRWKIARGMAWLVLIFGALGALAWWLVPRVT
ncbi:MAG TPA: hypothetical protein VH165_20575 [Kofleriaceae bacterium]|nr:hypothetical protein [Kofleriaceae bacterium]